ncbi:hypothetical protein IW138_003189 [Coemansia sp. RSA 986]|nr:hypothetical protein IW138_003189 [Coemansia sp. RSA 986]
MEDPVLLIDNWVVGMGCRYGSIRGVGMRLVLRQFEFEVYLLEKIRTLELSVMPQWKEGVAQRNTIPLGLPQPDAGIAAFPPPSTSAISSTGNLSTEKSPNRSDAPLLLLLPQSLNILTKLGAARDTQSPQLKARIPSVRVSATYMDRCELRLSYCFIDMYDRESYS